MRASLTCVSVCASRTGLHRKVCVAEQPGEPDIGCRAGKYRWLCLHQALLGGFQGCGVPLAGVQRRKMRSLGEEAQAVLHLRCTLLT